MPDLAFYAFASDGVEMVSIAIITGFTVAFDILSKGTALQISHTYCSKWKMCSLWI